MINAVSDGKGGEGIDLVSGKLLDVPKEFFTWLPEQRDKWSKENNVDLVVDHGGNRGQDLYLYSEGLTTASLDGGRWDNATIRELQSAVAQPTPPAYYGAANAVRDSQGGQFALHGEYAYLLNNNLPATFAFKTRKGDIGVLQVLGFTEENRRGVRIRYKFAQVARGDTRRQPGRRVKGPARLVGGGAGGKGKGRR